MRLSLKGGLVILCVLIPCVLAEGPYFLTTRERVDAKKAETLKVYTRGEFIDRLRLYTDWDAADVRFRKKFALLVQVRIVGVDSNDLGLDAAKIERLEKTIEEKASRILKGRGFDVRAVSDDLNMVDVTVYIIRARPNKNIYIIDGNLVYRRALLDRQSGKSISATMHEQRNLNYADSKEDIESLAELLCMGSVENFCDQMRDDETMMEAYYELLAKGLIEKYVPTK